MVGSSCSGRPKCLASRLLPSEGPLHSGPEGRSCQPSNACTLFHKPRLYACLYHPLCIDSLQQVIFRPRSHACFALPHLLLPVLPHVSAFLPTSLHCITILNRDPHCHAQLLTCTTASAVTPLLSACWGSISILLGQPQSRAIACLPLQRTFEDRLHAVSTSAA